MLFPRLPLFVPLAITIVATVAIIITLQSFLSYQSTKEVMVDDLQRKSINSLDQLRKNMIGFIESYAINEYDILALNEMSDPNYLAITVADYNMGQITGETIYTSGKIRGMDWQVIDFDPDNAKHLEQIKAAYYSGQTDIHNLQGDTIATVSIYLSDSLIQQQLNETIRQNIVNALTLIFLLTISLFFSIRYFTLKPLEDIVRNIHETDHEGIPVNQVTIKGTREIMSLTNAMNLMIETIKNSRDQLRRVQKMDAVGQLAGGIAHDFNNILGIIMGNLSFLKSEIGDNKKALKRIRSADKAARRAADLTRQLLDFSRDQTVDEGNYDINRIVLGMDQLIAHSLTPKIEVEKNFAEDLWLTKINPGDFEDAVLNLILNARDAMAGGGLLTLETRNSILDTAYCTQNPDATPGEYVLLSVSDSGEGMPAEQQERIFEPFFTTKPMGKGTGLGLSMTFGFVNRCKGHIKVYSEPEVGTSIRLYLPRVEGSEHEDDITELQLEHLPGGSETILVVDDETGILEIAKEYLEALGYRVFTATNDQRALEQLALHPNLSLLFSDVVMPGGMNGYELAEQAVAAQQNLKVLLASSYTKNAVALNDRVNFDANLLSKPYTQLELALRVRAVLDKNADVDPGNDTKESPRLIEWQDRFSVGVDAIDRDHKALIGMLNRARQIAESAGSTKQLADILSELQQYTQYHFRREEAMMEACDYPDLENHRKAHQFLIRQVAEIQQQLQQGHLQARDLVVYLNNWWVDHIQGMDQAYASICEGRMDFIENVLKTIDTDHGPGLVD